jgi:ABC-type Fe3+/spermidine/putrescine transport system ATPase subunit
MLVLLGPSGCGKTTTLQLVAGLLHPDDGSIIIDGKAVAGPGWGLPPERRNLGMVFQSYAVWPHRPCSRTSRMAWSCDPCLGTNFVAGCNRRSISSIWVSWARAILRDFWRPAARCAGESHCRRAFVAAAGRAAQQPRCDLAGQMRIELKLLQRKLGLASIYVTHDQAEAMVLADHLVVMRDGIVEQQGPAEAVFLRPRSGFIARFLGVTNLLKGRVIEMAQNRARVEIGALGTLSAFVADDVRMQLTLGDAACVSIRPLELPLSASRPPAATNTFQEEGSRSESSWAT